MAACRMNETFHQHIPVLLREAVENLVLSPHGIYIDATFGRGSHSQAILDLLDKNGRLIGFDKDPDAIDYAQHTFHDSRFTIYHTSFADMQTLLEKEKVWGHINGILFDLGVSSPQLDNPTRGFSFTREGILDMRMNTRTGVSAMQWLAQVGEAELADVLYEYGEEKFSRRIAKAIVTARNQAPIKTTTQLADIIKFAMPKPKTRSPQDKHPATRSFQAIRIVVNQELAELQQGLADALEALAIGGRLVVISFHSLEDRIVKQFIKQHEKGKEIPRGLPIKKRDMQMQSRLKSLGKPIKPNLQEMNMNPRSRSATLRIAEKQL